MASKTSKTPIAVLIGGGSKLPHLIKAAKSSKSKFEIKLVVSHKKKSEGIELALKNNIPAVYFNLVNWRRKTGKTRSEYAKYLGWFISQKTYQPKLLIFAGWDLILDKNFFNYFKTKIGDGYSAINLHPAPMRFKNEKEIVLPDGSNIPVIKGEQADVLKTVLKKNYTYFGASTHFMNPANYDSGEVIEREFIKVGNSKTQSALQAKLMPVEDKILNRSINKVIDQL